MSYPLWVILLRKKVPQKSWSHTSHVGTSKLSHQLSAYVIYSLQHRNHNIQRGWPVKDPLFPHCTFSVLPASPLPIGRLLRTQVWPLRLVWSHLGSLSLFPCFLSICGSSELHVSKSLIIPYDFVSLQILFLLPKMPLAPEYAFKSQLR